MTEFKKKEKKKNGRFCIYGALEHQVVIKLIKCGSIDTAGVHVDELVRVRVGKNVEN